jgi:cysteine desulfurase / selenocysteine lyase
MYSKDFPMLSHKMNGKDLIYFDSAATSQKPQKVIDTITDFYTNHYSSVHRSVYTLGEENTEQYYQVRTKIKNFVNAESENEIVFTKGTTDSINLVAHSYIKKGDEIVITAMEHHSNIVPWQLACEEKGATLKVIPMNKKGDLILDENIFSEKTKLLAVCHVSNSLGTINPIKQIIAMAHSAGAKVLVDGAQSTPHMPVDVRDLDADFYAFSGHKMYGPTGIGVLYGKEALLAEMPPYQGGGDMIEEVTLIKSTYALPPIRFEAGTPMIAQVLGLGAAIDYINKIGIQNIQQHEETLLRYALEKMNGVCVVGAPEHRAGIISFVVEGKHPLDIGTLLSLKGVAVRTGHHCAQPVLRHFGLTSTVRVSFGLYNTKEEIDLFVEILEGVLKLL